MVVAYNMDSVELHTMIKVKSFMSVTVKLYFTKNSKCFDLVISCIIVTVKSISES